MSTKQIITDKNEVVRMLKEGDSFKGCIVKDISFEGDTFDYPVNFSFAELDNTSFRRTQFGNEKFPQSASFEYAIFSSEAYFQDATFSGDADFAGANFSDKAYFRYDTFLGDTDFAGASFFGGADFCDATFSGERRTITDKNEVVRMLKNRETFIKYIIEDISFDGETFDYPVDFSFTELHNITFYQTEFGTKDSPQMADFESTIFYGEADFGSAIFSSKAYFRYSTFSDKADFGNAIFSDNAYFLYSIFSGKADFESTIFYGEADFNGIRFTSEAFFYRVTFSGEADFAGASFSDKADFMNSIFSDKASFWATTFSGEASFEEAIFSSGTYFIGTEFSTKEETSFAYTTFEKPNNVHFQSVYLGKTLFNSTNTPLVDIDFTIGPKDWGGCEWWLWDRVCLYNEKMLHSRFHGNDENTTNNNVSTDGGAVGGSLRAKRSNLLTSLKERLLRLLHKNTKEPRNDEVEVVYIDYDKIKYPKCTVVEKLYRELKQNYEKKGDFSRAGDFHYGELEMKRMAIAGSVFSKWFKMEWWLYTLYKVLSGYGEHWGQALIILFMGVFLGFAPLQLILGFKELHYTWTWNISDIDIGQIVCDYWKSVLYTLQNVTFSKELALKLKEDGYFAMTVSWFGRIFLPIQATLIVLAVRRRFKR